MVQREIDSREKSRRHGLPVEDGDRRKDRERDRERERDRDRQRDRGDRRRDSDYRRDSRDGRRDDRDDRRSSSSRRDGERDREREREQDRYRDGDSRKRPRSESRHSERSNGSRSSSSSSSSRPHSSSRPSSRLRTEDSRKGDYTPVRSGLGMDESEWDEPEALQSVRRPGSTPMATPGRTPMESIYGRGSSDPAEKAWEEEPRRRREGGEWEDEGFDWRSEMRRDGREAAYKADRRKQTGRRRGEAQTKGWGGVLGLCFPIVGRLRE